MARSYGEGCPIALSLDILGERWALLVVREFRLGSRRYRDLEEALPGVTPAVLSRRVRSLEETGVLSRRQLPPPASVQVYALTSWGAELEPVFQALARWGVRSPVVPLAGEISADSVMLGLRTFFNSEHRGRESWTATYSIWLDRNQYWLRIEEGLLVDLIRGSSAEDPDVLVRTSKTAWQEVLGRKQPLLRAMAAETLEASGDLDALQRLIDAAGRPATSEQSLLDS